MYQTRSGYDRGVNTFSPEGRLFQVEYAVKSIELGTCAIGIRTSEGIVLGVEKRATSPLLVNSSVEKIFELEKHVATATSGLSADARTLVEHARLEALNHAFTYDEPMRMRFGEGDDDEDEDEEDKKQKMSRPFGVSMLIAGIDKNGPQLFHTDPSGTYVGYDAQAIGNGSETARNALKEKYHKSLSLREAQILVLRILGDTMEDKISDENVDVAIVAPTGDARFGSFRMMQGQEKKDMIKEAQEAKAREEGV